MKRTLEEYNAQAMLLGMVYDGMTNTFFQLELGPTFKIAVEVDADTMQPLTRDEVRARQMEVTRTNDIKSSDDFAPSARLP